jgi:hypothetical protein
MCQAKDHFMFCSCVEEELKTIEDSRENYFTWSLWKYLGSRQSTLTGKIKIPKKNLGSGISEKAICKQLNSAIHSFDFDYTPRERDTLHIKVPDLEKDFHYFSLIFRDGVWQYGRNPAFASTEEKIASGVIKKQGTWVKNPKDDLEAIFSAYLANPDDYRNAPDLRRLVKKDPALFFKKAQQLFSSKWRREREISAHIFVMLFQMEYDFETVKSILFEFLQSNENRQFFRLVLGAFQVKNELLTASEITLICSFKILETDVREGIIRAFEGLNHQKIIAILIEFSSDKDANIRKKAVHNLRQVIDISNADRIQKALWPRIDDSSKEVRLEAMIGLAVLQDKNIKEVLLEELKAEYIMKLSLLDAIEALEDNSFIPHLETQIERINSPGAYISRRIATAIKDLQKL